MPDRMSYIAQNTKVYYEQTYEKDVLRYSCNPSSLRTKYIDSTQDNN